MTFAAAIAFTLAVVAALSVFILLPTVAYSSTATATSCAATPAGTDNYTAPWPAGHAYHSDTHAVSKPYNLSLPPRGRSWQTCVRWPTNIIPFDEMSGWRFSRWKRRHIGPHGAEAFLGHEGNNALVPQRNGGCLEYMPRWGDSDRGSGSLHKTLAVLSRLTRPGDIALEIGTFMGMSTFHIAHNLPKGAKVVTLDGAGLPFETATNSKTGHVLSYPSYIPGHVFINATRASRSNRRADKFASTRSTRSVSCASMRCVAICKASMPAAIADSDPVRGCCWAVPSRVA